MRCQLDRAGPGNPRRQLVPGFLATASTEAEALGVTAHGFAVIAAWMGVAQR